MSAEDWPLWREVEAHRGQHMTLHIDRLRKARKQAITQQNIIHRLQEQIRSHKQKGKIMNEKVQNGPAAEDEPFGSLEGAVNGEALGAKVLADLPPMEVVAEKAAALPVAEPLPVPAEKMDPLGPMEVRGYYVTGPAPMLALKPVKGSLSLKLVLESEAKARIVFYEELNASAMSALKDATEEAGRLYAVAQREHELNAKVVNMIERLHAVIARCNDEVRGVDYEAAARIEGLAYDELVAILAEDLPK